MGRIERGHPVLGCLHGHHANIAPLDGVFPQGAVEVVHYVDPGLLRRQAADPVFPEREQRARVRGELAWIAAGGCDAVVVTCTAYAALADDGVGSPLVPVVTIDGPLFADLARRDGPVALVFTNPGTVAPTIARLRSAIGPAAVGVDPVLISDAFDLVMRGRTADYADRVAAGLDDLVRSGRYRVVVAAQLSMAEPARRVPPSVGVEVLTPLEPLAARLAALLGLRPSLPAGNRDAAPGPARSTRSG